MRNGCGTGIDLTRLARLSILFVSTALRCTLVLLMARADVTTRSPQPLAAADPVVAGQGFT
jgi:hypothetical protein